MKDRFYIKLLRTSFQQGTHECSKKIKVKIYKNNFYERLFLHKIILHTISTGVRRNGNEKNFKKLLNYFF